MDIQQFKKSGFTQTKLQLPPEIEALIAAEKYQELDIMLAGFLKENGIIYNTLLPFGPIAKPEYIIAIRNGEDDEDGIWHDDGSRDLAFTLSLVSNLEQLAGGVLLLREKNNPNHINQIPTAPFGTLTVMKTGKDGYEHKVEKVTRGKRIICAGWINHKINDL